ncbi:MAG: DEAD/DEAH box helicase [Deltaproteobacteria bacterium]|nr:DEAD/DEAH box helicase [Deltaproteobacteria bacterium]
MRFEIGSLVKARGREWVVLPETARETDTLVVRPLGGTDDEVTGIYLPLETVESAQFLPPDPREALGNHQSCALLRDAVQLGFRSAAGPFRSLARIAVEPRPYQLVPLLMALKQDPVRLLIADDVGVGKTIEALLVARELLDRGEVRRMAVLCPPHLAEQWQRAMKQQFHLDAALVLASTAGRLERDCGPGESLFDRHPLVIVSLDYIKSDKRCDTFVRACPELVIVDEAHTCTDAGAARSIGQRRHALLRRLVDPHGVGADRHLLLVTATPHSGNPESFRSMLSLLDPSFATLPEDLGGEVNRKHRERLALHVAQRSRGDVTNYPVGEDTSTPFPTRKTADTSYLLSDAYAAFFKKVVLFCRSRVLDESLGKQRQRVRWWSALALLRSVGSSPAAAAATLRNRAQTDTAESPEEVDELGRRSVLDLDDEGTEGIDVVHGTQEGDDSDSDDTRALRKLAKEADALRGEPDAKLRKAIDLIHQLVRDGSSPIVFCRFIPTVEYLVEALRARFKDKIAVEGVTGDLPPEDREERVESLAKRPHRVLVCTDCLSEGINLQHAFDAVFHYDLSWNPTRHEQREGRVDRFGQEKREVHTVTYYGEDSPIDTLVRKKLLEKHRTILKQLGVYVPVPQESDRLVEALVREVFFGSNDPTNPRQLNLALQQDVPLLKEVELRWDRAVEREKRSRQLFAQHAIKTEDVATEVAEARRALGGESDVQRFVLTAASCLGATVSSSGPPFQIDLRETPAALRDAIVDDETSVRVAFRGMERDGIWVLGRTHPFVAGLAAYVLETALDAKGDGPARRCGVVRTNDVAKRTTVLVARARYHLVTVKPEQPEQALLAEDVFLAAFEGSPDEPEWLDESAVARVLAAKPSQNVAVDLARTQLGRIVERLSVARAKLDALAKERGKALLASHRRVREAAKARTKTVRVEPHLPADVLGVFVYLPAGGAS